MSNSFDYKKEFKKLYQPKTDPFLIEVPAMSFIMVDGKGNPNDEDGEYSQAVEILYALSYVIKMSKMGNTKLDGYFEYVVPPLEGFWWLEDQTDMDFTQKDQFCWTSLIRQPEFVNQDSFLWACDEVKNKKPHMDVSKARFEVFTEGLCVQAMHLGSYDDEAQTIEKIEDFIKNNNLANDICSLNLDGKVKHHHEIYISNPRKVAPEKRKTIIRHPVRIVK